LKSSKNFNKIKVLFCLVKRYKTGYYFLANGLKEYIKYQISKIKYQNDISKIKNEINRNFV